MGTGDNDAMTFRTSATMLAALAIAAVSSPNAQAGWLDEAKMGVLEHDVPIGGRHVEPGEDINGELLFRSPGLFDLIGAPRPHLGGSVNSSGATSYGYAGLTWTATFWSSVFASLGLGGAVHNGQLDEPAAHRKELGSRALFHEELDLGVRFASRYSLSLFIDHLSDADLTRHNAGLTNIGLRTGYKF